MNISFVFHHQKPIVIRIFETLAADLSTNILRVIFSTPMEIKLFVFFEIYFNYIIPISCIEIVND